MSFATEMTEEVSQLEANIFELKQALHASNVELRDLLRRHVHLQTAHLAAVTRAMIDEEKLAILEKDLGGVH